MVYQDFVNNIKRFVQSGQFAEALNLFEQIQDFNSLANEEQTELLYLKAVSYRYTQQISKALSTLTNLLKNSPSYARAYQEQGYCFIAQQNIEKALVALHKAVELNPALISAWQKIVELFQQTKHTNYESAKSQLELLQALPKQVITAMDLMHEGKLYKAEQVCRRFLQQNGNQPDAMCLLAEIGLQLKVFDDAEFLLESCVKLYPRSEQAKAGYVNVLNRLGKFKQAKYQAQEFLQAFPSETLLKVTIEATLANCEVSLGELDSGIAIYKSILKRHPERAGISIQLGHAYKTIGDIDNAIVNYQAGYQKQKNYGDAYWSLANIKTYQFTSEELDNLLSAVDSEQTAIEDKIHMSFALGKAYEDKQEFDESFKYYQQGNQLKHDTLSYDANNTSELINQQIKHCTKELFEKRKDAGCQSNAPIFILGLPRAGSTLLEQILASHSQVDGTMELHNILGTALKLRGRIAGGESQYPQNLWQLPDEQLKQLGEKFIEDTQVYRKGAPLFIDKMPNNFIHIGLIKLILPNAKIIDARREPVACCFSGFKQLFGEGQEFSYNLSDIAQYYKDYEKLMQHWQKVLPGQILKVQHEELVTDFEAQVKRILEHCGLEFESSCLEFHKTKRTIHTPSAQQVRQPISSKGLEHWQKFDSHLGELKDTFYQS